MTTAPIPVVLVTGASRGLGRGIAREAAASGWSVAINYAGNSAAATETVTLCEQQKLDPRQKFLPVQGDISRREDRERMLQETLNAFGRLDALVNNAGIAPRQRKDLTEMTEESFEEVLRVNLQGPHFLTQSVVRYWLDKKPAPAIASGFKIVFVTSVSANTVSLNRGEYCISKAGLAMVNQLWATRLAPEGIQVFEIRPGVMATDMTSAVKEKYDAMMAEGLVPLRRWGTGEDVGRAVAAILTGKIPYSTGDVINIDGGLHLRIL